MLYDSGSITVTYQDDRVFSQGKSYPSGYFLVSLLNYFRKHDVSIDSLKYSFKLSKIRNEIMHGRCDKTSFEEAQSIIMRILDYLPTDSSNISLDIEAKRSYAHALLSETNRQQILTYFENTPEGTGLPTITQADVESYEIFCSLNRPDHIYQNVLKLLKYYCDLDQDIRSASISIQNFTQQLFSLPRLDEKHMLPLAVDIFGYQCIGLRTAYVPIQKTSRSKSSTLARQVHFDNIKSFILTDFYEGLHHGHYPQRCAICGKLFLMTSARRQIYCDGLSPHMLRGKQLSCRKYAAAIGRKELAESDPVTDRYNRRCAAIRTEKGRGTITPEFAEAAIKLAKEHKLKALQDESYAHKQYELDMTRDKLYADTKERLK